MHDCKLEENIRAFLNIVPNIAVDRTEM